MHYLPSTKLHPAPTALVVLLLLLAALPARAQTNTPYTATGWVIGVPMPGIWCTNRLGQVAFHGNVHLAGVESTDPRLAGRRTIFVDAAAQVDGSAILYGAAYQQVGTWDAAGTNFTATSGMWEMSYRGTMGADGSLQLHIVGFGVGGAIDGLRLDETLTRAAGAILDPAIPHNYTGTIKPPPLNSSEVLDNFDDNKLTGWIIYGSVNVVETDQQLKVRGYWPGVRTIGTFNTMGFGVWSKSWTIRDGQTLEWRVDLIRQDDNATNAAKVVFGTTSGVYGFFLGRDFVFAGKYAGSGSSSALYFFDRAPIGDTNRVFALTLTRVGPNLVLTTRVFDRNDPKVVLYERSIVDTP